MASVTPNIVSNEEDEPSVVAKITSGEADAAHRVPVVSVTSDVNAVDDPGRRQRDRHLPDRRGERQHQHDRRPGIRDVRDRVRRSGHARVVRIPASAHLVNRRARRRIHPTVAALAALGTALVALPLVALLVRAPGATSAEALSANGAWVAFRLSLQVSLTATAVSVLLGLPIAWVLARGRFRGRNVLRAVVDPPARAPPGRRRDRAAGLRSADGDSSDDGSMTRSGSS